MICIFVNELNNNTNQNLMPMQNNKINFEGQSFYIGIDVHAKNWNVTILSETLFLKTFNQPPEAEALKSYLVTHYPGAQYYSAYEAGFCGFAPHYALEACGIHNIVFNPADISDTAKERSRKTDSTDSNKIARNLRNKELSPIYVPTKQELAHRDLVRTRFTIAKEIIRVKQRIKALLKFHGLKPPKNAGIYERNWSRAYLSWIKEAIKELPITSQEAMKVLLNLREYLHAENLRVCLEIHHLMKNELNKAYELILTVPGIGFIVAAAFLTEICDIKRFKSTDALAAFIGLVPDTHSTGDKDVTLGVTVRANAQLRHMLIESAWHAARKDPALSLAYSNLVKRMEPNKAIIRIARKLLNRIYAVLKTEKPYVCSVVR